MRPLLNMTGCKWLGDITGQKDGPVSICGPCGRPLGRCQWLRQSRPYAGSSYYTVVTSLYTAYVMASCPLYEEPTEEVKEGMA